LARLRSYSPCGPRDRDGYRYDVDIVHLNAGGNSLTALGGELTAKIDAFISYSSKDKTAADAACAALESAGVRCWIASRDIRPGEEYGAAIIDAIERCRVMVLIFSSSANQSCQVRREIERVVSKGIPIIPVRIEDVVPTKSIEYFLGAIHWLDALTPPLEGHLQKLAETVTEALLQMDAAAQIRIDKPLDKTGAVVGALRKKAVVGSPTRDIKRRSTRRKERHGLCAQCGRWTALRELHN